MSNVHTLTMFNSLSYTMKRRVYLFVCFSVALKANEPLTVAT